MDAVPETLGTQDLGFRSGLVRTTARDAGIPRMLLPGSFRPGRTTRTRPLAARLAAMTALWFSAVAALIVLSR